MKLELHLIQSFPPSCLNRDATGSPKDCEFGGVRRARVSSQCFKRAMRGFFREHNLVPVGERTKRLRDELVPLLGDLQPAELVAPGVDAFIHAFYSKNDAKKAEHAAVLLFLSHEEIKVVAQIVRENWEELQKVAALRAKRMTEIEAKKGKTKQAPTSTEEITSPAADSSEESGDGKYKDLPPAKFDSKVHKSIKDRLEHVALSADIALFGRMLANEREQVDIKKEAACQVAHAISTHAVAPELDFFSAVDDLNTDDAGAGMLGTTGFNAAVFYRYALLDFDALQNNLGGDEDAALRTAHAFAQAFVEAIPTGKQNSMAAQSLPSLGFLVVRESGAPCSLVNAFCTPVRPAKDKGLLDKSVAELAAYWARTLEVYGDEGVVSTSLFCLDGRDDAAILGAPSSKKAAIETAVAALSRAKAGV